jgi:predicted ribosome quality control (RQC) complex YloA/Tae2 family protein
VSSDGLEILVGRNNRQNDLLTLKLARPDDWWFHTQVIPGSHVLVRGVTGELPIRTRDEAAMLAAWFSQARASSKVPVVFTRKRFVKKPSGAKPGMVIYEQEKTLFVTPDAAAIAQISQEAAPPVG